MRVPRVGRALLGVLALLAALAVSPAARADTVVDWNQIASKAIQGAPSPPPPAIGGAGQGALSFVHMTMVHGAIYDALNAIDGGRYEPLVSAPRARSWYSQDAAAATAAYRVLSAGGLRIPAAQQPVILAAYQAVLLPIPDGPAKQGGIDTGNAAADAMIAARADDGRFGTFQFVNGTLPGQWRPELPLFASDSAAWLKDVRPFVIRDTERFAGRPPHGITSRKYARDLAEVKEIGSISSTTRSEDQTTAARFWGTANATETWSTLLRNIANRQGGSQSEHARMFARVYANIADAAIVTWIDKARYSFWRPITAIRTTSDPNWLPLINTPPYPDHPSGLAAVGGAAAETLRDFYGTDAVDFGAESSAGEARGFASFSQAVDDIVDARVWSGIHFRFADEQGAKIGRHVARWGDRHAFRAACRR